MYKTMEFPEFLVYVKQNKFEGLILRGCGGDPMDWIDGINGVLFDEEIVKTVDASNFSEYIVFNENGITNIAFIFSDGNEIDISKLAIWRLKTRDAFGGIWVSDYVA